MVDLTYQWLFVVTDITSKEERASFIKSGQDGFNIAFVFNTSESDTCKRGLLCVVSDLIRNMARSFENILLEDMADVARYGQDVWGVIKPSPLERLSRVKTELGRLLTTTGQCDMCTTWKLEVS